MADRRAALPALLVAGTISTAGTRMSQIAVPWLVLQQTGSPVLTGLVGAAEIAPYVLLQFLGAPLVDRFGALRVAIIGDVVAAAAMGAIGLLGLTGPVNVAGVLALVFVAGLARGPADAATDVLVPSVAALAATPIERAAALVDGSSRLAQVLGALVGGALIAVLGANDVVLVDALTFGAAAALLLLIPVAAGRTRAIDDDADPEPYLRRLAEGLRFVRANPLIRSIAGMVMFTNFADAAMSGLLALLWAERSGFGAAGVGFVSGALGASAIVGALLFAAFGARLSRHRTFAWSFLLAGAPRFVALVLPLPLWAVIAIWAIAGLGVGTINPLLSAAEYQAIPRQLQARVLATVGAVAWAGIPLGPLAAAASVGLVGFMPTVVAFAAVYFVATLSPFVQSSWSLLDAQPQPSAA